MKKMPEINFEKYKADFCGYKYPISFVGNPGNRECLQILCSIVKIYGRKVNIFCAEEVFLESVKKAKEEGFLGEDELPVYLKCRKDFINSEEELSRIYNASKINLCIFTEGKNENRKQVFEVLLSGGFVIANEQEILAPFFEKSRHLEIYQDVFDLVDKIDFYLKNLNIAQKIAQLGRIEIIKNYTLIRRLKNKRRG